MQQVVKKPLTNQSFLLQEHTGKSLYLCLVHDNESVSLISPAEVVNVSKSDFSKSFEIIEAEEKIGTEDIDGYPIVSHHYRSIEELIKIEEHCAYTVGGRSYLAGYWASKNNSGTWVVSLSPKIKNEKQLQNMKGPFKDKLQALTEASIQNQK